MNAYHVTYQGTYQMETSMSLSVLPTPEHLWVWLTIDGKAC